MESHWSFLWFKVELDLRVAELIEVSQFEMITIIFLLVKIKIRLIVALSGEQLYTVMRPNMGTQFRQETIGELKKRNRKVNPDEAQPIWNAVYEATQSGSCLHQYL